MSLAQRFERRLEGVVGSAFARVFKGQVEPVEIGNALQGHAREHHAVMPNGVIQAPNRYRVSLGQSDWERLAPWEVQLCNSLAELVQEYLDEQGWTTVGDIEVILHLDEALHVGVFGIASRMEPQAAPRQRPYESLSLPYIEGAPGRYERPFGSPPPVAHPPAAPAAPSAYDHHGAPEQPFDYERDAYDYGAANPDPIAASAYAQPAGYSPPAPPYIEPRRTPQVRGVLAIDGSPTHLILRRGSNVIGRGHDADLQVLDQGVSRRHVDVQFDGEFAVAYDLGSTNGTSVNGHDIGSQQLQHGDVVRVGHTRIVYHQENG